MKMMRNIIPFINLFDVVLSLEISSTSVVFCYVIYDFIVEQNICQYLNTSWLLLLFFSPRLMHLHLGYCCCCVHWCIHLFSYFSWESRIENERGNRVKLRIFCKRLKGTRKFMKPIHHQCERKKKNISNKATNSHFQISHNIFMNSLDWKTNDVFSFCSNLNNFMTQKKSFDNWWH